MMNKPVKILEGQFRIGIIQTADMDRLFPIRYERAKKELQKAFSVSIHDYTEYSNPIVCKNPQKEYAKRFADAVRENELLISLTGGYTTNCMLPYVDYELVESRRPVIVGYSDTTALLSAVLVKANLACIYGPALLGSFGEWPHVNGDTVKSLKENLFTKGEIIYEPPEVYSTSNYFWDVEDRQELGYVPQGGWRSNCDAVVRGTFWGGNMNTIHALYGTEFWNMPEHTLLLLEDAFTSMAQIKRDLETLRQRGAFAAVAGVIFGKFYSCGGEQQEFAMNQYVLDFFSDLSIPVIVNVDVGHCVPILSVILGLAGEVDYKRCRLKRLEGLR